MNNKKLYMHIDTGSVDTEAEWINEISDEKLEEVFKEGTTKQEAFDQYCRDGKFVEVVALAEGGYAEPEKAAVVNAGCNTTSVHHIDLIASYMDDEIREQVHHELAPCTAQEFVDRYCELYKEKFGEDFCIN